MVIKSACKSGSGMQTANKHVRDVVAMSGKAGSEGNARASGLLLAEKYSRRRCKQEKEMGDFHPVHLRGGDCYLLRPIHGTTSAFCCLPSTAGWLRFNRETPYSPRCDCEQNPPQRRFTSCGVHNPYLKGRAPQSIVWPGLSGAHPVVRPIYVLLYALR